MDVCLMFLIYLLVPSFIRSDVLICAGAWDFPVVKSLRIPGGDFELTTKYTPNCTPKYTPKYTLKCTPNCTNTLPNTLPNALLIVLPIALSYSQGETP